MTAKKGNIVHQLLNKLQDMSLDSELHAGTRVVRGPDWRWRNEDGGEGHVGTVVNVKGPRSLVKLPGSTAPEEKCVTVMWDNGEEHEHRAGKDGAFDLRIFDNAPSGVTHPNVTCSECKTPDIRGIRWKCSQCNDYDLCHVCYMGDKHYLKHKFFRIDRPKAGIELMPSRAESVREKVQSRGIFKGATVARSSTYGKNDGNSEKEGKVVKIQDHGKDSGRSEAIVTWSLLSRNCSCRVGHNGQVDLKYVVPGDGLVYYRSHLPVLGKLEALSTFAIGDKVMCVMEAGLLKEFQQHHDMWDKDVVKYRGKVGSVCDKDENGNVKVAYDDGKRWWYNPAALVKVTLTIQDMMTDDIVQKVLEIDIPEHLVVKALEKRLAAKGEQFKNAQELIDAILVDNCSTTAQSDPAPPRRDVRLDCRVCMDRQADITFVPCGHLMCCGACAAAVKCCPVCREEIKIRIRTFIV